MNLNQITIPSINVPKAIKFYQQLGFKLIVHTTDNYARFECTTGDSTFSIHAVNNLPKGNGIWVYFECENLDKTVKDLIKKGIEFEEEVTDKTWLWTEAKLKDLDGNQIILYKAGENRKNPPWKLKD